MPKFELRFYGGSKNWVLEGQGYWCTSKGEFSKVSENPESYERNMFEDLKARRNDGLKDFLVDYRVLTPEECVLYSKMMRILEAVVVSFPQGEGLV